MIIESSYARYRPGLWRRCRARSDPLALLPRDRAQRQPDRGVEALAGEPTDAERGGEEPRGAARHLAALAGAARRRADTHGRRALAARRRGLSRVAAGGRAHSRPRGRRGRALRGGLLPLVRRVLLARGDAARRRRGARHRALALGRHGRRGAQRRGRARGRLWRERLAPAAPRSGAGRALPRGDGRLRCTAARGPPRIAARDTAPGAATLRAAHLPEPQGGRGARGEGALARAPLALRRSRARQEPGVAGRRPGGAALACGGLQPTARGAAPARPLAALRDRHRVPLLSGRYASHARGDACQRRARAARGRARRRAPALRRTQRRGDTARRSAKEEEGVSAGSGGRVRRSQRRHRGRGGLRPR